MVETVCLNGSLISFYPSQTVWLRGWVTLYVTRNTLCTVVCHEMTTRCLVSSGGLLPTCPAAARGLPAARGGQKPPGEAAEEHRIHLQQLQEGPGEVRQRHLTGDAHRARDVEMWRVVVVVVLLHSTTFQGHFASRKYCQQEPNISWWYTCTTIFNMFFP